MKYIAHVFYSPPPQWVWAKFTTNILLKISQNGQNSTELYCLATTILLEKASDHISKNNFDGNYMKCTELYEADVFQFPS